MIFKPPAAPVDQLAGVNSVSVNSVFLIHGYRLKKSKK